MNLHVRYFKYLSDEVVFLTINKPSGVTTLKFSVNHFVSNEFTISFVAILLYIFHNTKGSEAVKSFLLYRSIDI